MSRQTSDYQAGVEAERARFHRLLRAALSICDAGRTTLVRFLTEWVASGYDPDGERDASEWTPDYLAGVQAERARFLRLLDEVLHLCEVSQSSLFLVLEASIASGYDPADEEDEQ